MNLSQKPIDSTIQLAKTASKNCSTKKTIGCFVETIGCLYQQTTNKLNLKRYRDREIVHNCLYWFTPNQSYIQSSQKPWGYLLSNHHLITYTTTKRMTLNTSRNTLSLANTKIANLEHLKNTQPISANTKMNCSTDYKDYTCYRWISEINTSRILFQHLDQSQTLKQSQHFEKIFRKTLSKDYLNSQICFS